LPADTDVPILTRLLGAGATATERDPRTLGDRQIPIAVRAAKLRLRLRLALARHQIEVIRRDTRSPVRQAALGLL
jgi:hypothetical protein